MNESCGLSVSLEPHLFPGWVHPSGEEIVFLTNGRIDRWVPEGPYSS